MSTSSWTWFYPSMITAMIGVFIGLFSELLLDYVSVTLRVGFVTILASWSAYWVIRTEQRNTLYLALIVLLTALIAFVNNYTWFPFGSFTYSSHPTIAGVSLYILFITPVITITSWWIGSRSAERWRRVLTATMFQTAVFLVILPAMTALNVLSWPTPWYYGVSTSGFAGGLFLAVTSALIGEELRPHLTTASSQPTTLLLGFGIGVSTARSFFIPFIFGVCLTLIVIAMSFYE